MSTCLPVMDRQYSTAHGAAGAPCVGASSARAGPHLFEESEVPHVRRQRGPRQNPDGGFPMKRAFWEDSGAGTGKRRLCFFCFRRVCVFWLVWSAYLGLCWKVWHGGQGFP